MMDAIVSGSGGWAVGVEGQEFATVRLSGATAWKQANLSEVTYLLASISDGVILQKVTRDELQTILKLAKAIDDALSLALIILDRETHTQTRRMAMQELEPLLHKGTVAGRLEAIFCGHPVPASGDLAAAVIAARYCQRVFEFFRRIRSLQASIRLVANAWHRIPESLFGSASERVRARRLLVVEGCFRDAAIDVENRKAIASFPKNLACKREFQLLPDHHTLIEAWNQGLDEVNRARSAAEKDPEYEQDFKEAWEAFKNAKDFEEQSRCFEHLLNSRNGPWPQRQLSLMEATEVFAKTTATRMLEGRSESLLDPTDAAMEALSQLYLRAQQVNQLWPWLTVLVRSFLTYELVGRLLSALDSTLEGHSQSIRPATDDTELLGNRRNEPLLTFLREALNELPPESGEVIFLYYKGLSSREIAEKLRVTLATVRKSLDLGRKSLKSILVSKINR